MNRHEKRALASTIRHQAAESSCGTCTACCTALGVTSINKPAQVPCQFIALGVHGQPKGCSIYESRPRECRAFNCGWKHMNGIIKTITDADRPDKTGVVLGTISEKLGTFNALPAWPGAFDAPAGAEFIQRMVDANFAIVLIDGQQRRMVCKADHPSKDRLVELAAKAGVQLDM